MDAWKPTYTRRERLMTAAQAAGLGVLFEIALILMVLLS